MRARVQRKPRLVSITPEPALPAGLDSPNIFRDKFGDLDDEAWFDILTRALDAETIDGIRFPQYPSAELQNRVHGYSNRHALREAFDFYGYIKSHDFVREKFNSESYFLDFAAGWGRMSRPFLRHFDLSKTFSYEPNRAFCVIARTLNPYTCFFNGDYYPDGTLPAGRFDLVIGYSIFTHLSPAATATWLAEMARVMRPDGYCVFTTWGSRFLDRLINEAKDLAQGKDIHWYSKECLAVAGDVEALRRQYHEGAFIWFAQDPSSPYGEAFMPPPALTALLDANDIPFDLVEFDRDNLAQDAFILRRREIVTIAHFVPRAAAATVDQLAHDAWAAMERRDWNEAVDLWATVRAKAPERADSYIAASHALRQIGRLDDADAMSGEAVAHFPDSPDAVAAHAWAATSREDWDEAARRWGIARERQPDRPDAHGQMALALVRCNRFDEAEDVCRQALARFPDSGEVLFHYAWCAMGRWDWAEAARRWRTVCDRFPDMEEPHLHAIRTLRAARKLEDAEAMAGETIARFPESKAALVERIVVAGDRRDWTAAAAYLASAREAVTENGRLPAPLGWVDYRLRLMAANAPAADAPDIGLSDRELMLRFESLGQRCDFGVVQRNYGAEPLGLLRFANVPFEHLTAALDDGFAAVNEPHAVVFETYAGELVGTLRRYAITFHTHVYEKDLVSEADRQRFLTQQQQRLVFLREKLIADLENAEKIFVYANFEPLSDADFAKLFAAVRRYGAGRLLCVRPADAEHPDGTVERLRDGLFIGYLRLFADFGAGELPQHDSWRAICARTYLLAHGQAHVDNPISTATFCSHLWSQLRIEANGEARVCCAYEGPSIAQDGAAMSVGRHALGEIWNADEMRRLRGEIVAGRRIAGCRQCYTDEARGGISMRQRDNKAWEGGWLNPLGLTIADAVRGAAANGNRVDRLPALIEIETGNLCNLKCRMCNGNTSSLIAKDEVHRQWSDGAWLDAAGSSKAYRLRSPTAVARLAEELGKDNGSEVKRLYFIGGEPLLVREVRMLLERLVEAGHASEIELAFVSNGSTVPQWLSLAERFRRIDIAVSIDGYGQHLEYVRYPATWDELTNHLQQIRAIPNVTLGATSTLQINNALHITKLFRYLDAVDIPFNAYLLHWPRYLAVTALPAAIRRVAAERLRAYAQSDCYERHRELVVSLAAQFEAGNDTGDAPLLRDFMLFTNDLDASRGQSIHASDPELVALLAEAGFPWTGERLHAAPAAE
ncbi:MAG TPA: twitch domain-containing radical SAM protein [Stellaceae bacterium]|nr:twitch domain-containing radical SAM protein [Stellaceae bacterium]